MAIETNLYRLNTGAINAEQFESRLDQAWSQIQSDPVVASRLRTLGINPEEFKGKGRREFITIDQRSQAGLTGLETLGVNFLVGVSLKLFEAFILPYIVKGLNRDDIQLEKTAKAGQGASQQS